MIQPNQQEEPAPRRPFRRMILRNTAALPALVTLLNGISGFLAIHYATKAGLGQASVGNLNLSAFCIFAAMVFDGLDGRLARMTRHVSDFGGQLDSLCDAVSFGVAPAMLMVQTVATYLPGGEFDMFHQNSTMPGKLIFAIAILYVCCGILRLARFNTENAPDTLKHMSFKGLPIPGAAATVAAIVLLFDSVRKVAPNSPLQSLRQADWLEASIEIALPVTMALVALAMISKFRYVHVVNRFVVGKKPFGYLVKALVVILLGLAYPELMLALTTLAYAASGPLGGLVRHFSPNKSKLPPPTTT